MGVLEFGALGFSNLVQLLEFVSRMIVSLAILTLLLVINSKYVQIKVRIRVLALQGLG